MGPCSALMTHVAACPTRGPSSGKRARMFEERFPSSLGRYLKVSMALATLGLVIFLRASTCWVVSGTGDPPCATVGRPRGRLDGAFALLDERLLQLLDQILDLLEIRVDRQRALEVGERLLRLVEVKVDLPVARQGPPVLRVPLDHFVAVAQGLVVLAHEEVYGRALVPPLGEVGLELDDLGEGADGGLGLAVAHLLHADGEEAVHLRIAGAAPDLPDRVLRKRPHEVVLIPEGLE